MNTVKFSCKISNTNGTVPLGCEIWIDNTCLVNLDHVKNSSMIEHEFSDNEGDHVLRVILKNKQPEHTCIDQSGAIVSDALLTISDFNFDEIDCTQLVQTHAVYRHNFNGTGVDVENKFFGSMGCNGTVELKFTTPLYLWLLENM